MPLLLIFVVGVAVALIRRRLLVTPADPTYGQDPPARLVAWAAELDAGPRRPAAPGGPDSPDVVMELARWTRPAQRSRWALRCVMATVLKPPTGWAAAAVAGMTVLATSAVVVVAYTRIHYGLGADGWTWVGVTIQLLLLIGYVMGGSILLRRPGIAGPGLLGGLLLAAAWLIVNGITFLRWLTTLWSYPWLVILAPVLVGAGATLWAGDATVGRRVTRLATIVAALGIHLYGVLAVAVIGAGGPPIDPGWTTSSVVDDRLGDQVVFYLIALPLMTAPTGWAAAAATARLRHFDPLPGRAPATRRPRTAYLALAGAALAVSVAMVFLVVLRV